MYSTCIYNVHVQCTCSLNSPIAFYFPSQTFNVQVYHVHVDCVYDDFNLTVFKPTYHIKIHVLYM